MTRGSIDTIFSNLTDKQREALDLAAMGLTSKEIARKLKISPHSVDKRIDAVRAQLDATPRNRLVREFRHWQASGESITGDPSPLTPPPAIETQKSSQPQGETLLFRDVLTFDGAGEWESEPSRLRRGLEPSDLSVGGRLLCVLAGAILIAAAFVLVAASGNVLVDLLD